MRLFRGFAAALVGLAVMGVASSEVSANTIFVDHVDITSSGSEFTYSYRVSVGESGNIQAEVRTGDFFTIYDFAGFVAGSAVAPNSDWAFSSANTGINAMKTAPDDDASLPNLTWTYTGTTTIQADSLIGLFSANSIYGTWTEDDYTSQDHQSTDGGPFVQAGYVASTTVAAVPLPAAAWGGMVLFGLLGGAKLRRSRQLA